MSLELDPALNAQARWSDEVNIMPPDQEAVDAALRVLNGRSGFVYLSNWILDALAVPAGVHQVDMSIV